MKSQTYIRFARYVINKDWTIIEEKEDDKQNIQKKETPAAALCKEMTFCKKKE